MPIHPDTYTAIADLSGAFTPPSPGSFDDTDLLAAAGMLAAIGRRVDAATAAIAGEIAHRSRRELGYTGLAQRLGDRTPEHLVQRVTGASGREAIALVRVGGLLAGPAPDSTDSAATTDSTDSAATTAAPPVSATPWLAGVAAAVTTGCLSLEAADAIRRGLGHPSDTVTVDALTGAAHVLVAEATGATIDPITGEVLTDRSATGGLPGGERPTIERLAVRARQLRDMIDTTGIAEREDMLRERRYLHLIPQADGMTRLTGLLDPESAAIIGASYDTATSPRRGGPRFIDPGAKAAAEDLVRDPRTTPQIALDAIVELVRIGAAADPDVMTAGRRPAVQVLVTDTDLRTRTGYGIIDGQNTPVSLTTVDRHVCDTGSIPIMFDPDGQVIDIGRQMRLYQYRQRLGLAARDGGCRFPTCDRPASWTEAHHLVRWADGGRTDIADGLLLCRYHHMLVHNNGWDITRDGADYYFTPPTIIDPTRTPIVSHSRNTLIGRLHHDDVDATGELTASDNAAVLVEHPPQYALVGVGVSG